MKTRFLIIIGIIAAIIIPSITMYVMTKSSNPDMHPCQVELMKIMKNQEKIIIPPVNDTISGTSIPVWENEESKQEFIQKSEDCIKLLEYEN